MKLLFATGFQHLPQIYGGVMSNIHEMAIEITQAGHYAAVAADMRPTDLIGLRTRAMGKLTSKRTVHDNFLGYPVYRRWDVIEAIPDLVAEIKPDVAVVQPSHHMALARELLRASVPVIVYFHDVLFDRIDGDPRELENATFLSNSEFTASRYKAEYGISSTVIPPLFRSDLYRSKSGGENVTFVNPQPLKGRDLALEIVERCPDIPFRFVESWELAPKEKEMLKRYAKALPNLSLKSRTMNMKDVYRRAKLALMPSMVDEAWGRVASEAHFSGIPVVASDRGGLPEAVGPGGVLLDPEGPIEPWVQAIRRLWDEPAHYAELSAAALAYSRRPAIDPAAQIATLLSVANQAIAEQDGTPARAAFR